MRDSISHVIKRHLRQISLVTPDMSLKWGKQNLIVDDYQLIYK